MINDEPNIKFFISQDTKCTVIVGNQDLFFCPIRQLTRIIVYIARRTKKSNRKDRLGVVMINDKPNITLVRLVLKYPDWFYPQDWYYDEEFANTPLAIGDHRIGEGNFDPPAVACAWWAIRMGGQWGTSYVWTRDIDGRGNRVYVGGMALGHKRGFQIHRHLVDPIVSAINYSFEKA